MLTDWNLKKLNKGTLSALDRIRSDTPTSNSASTAALVLVLLRVLVLVLLLALELELVLIKGSTCSAPPAPRG